MIRRESSCGLILQSYGDRMTEPWIISGDCKNVLTLRERVGGNILSLAEIGAFKDCIEAPGCGI